MARTISSSTTGPIALAASDNPLSITSTGQVLSTGVADAIDGASGTIWTINNSGTISAASGFGIYLSGAGVVTSSGAITGKDGVILHGGGNVTNTGSIKGVGAVGGGPWQGSGVFIAGATGTVTNGGAINGQAYGVVLDSGGLVTNTGSIIGGEDGVLAFSLGTVINSGSIVATVGDAVGLHGGGSVTNQVGGSITGVGTQGAGVYIASTTGRVTNSGAITGIDYAVDLAAGGSVTNNVGASLTGHRGINVQGAAGTISNSGSISGAADFGVGLRAGGQVTNAAGASISGYWGVVGYNSAITITNSGTISGTGRAINFSGIGSNRLVAGATGVIIGSVVGSTASGSSNTLELAGGTGTLSGLSAGAGTVTENAHAWSFSAFNALALDTGAVWTATGQNSIATLADNGSLTIASAGTLTVTGTVDPASTGLFSLAGSAVLDFGGDVASGVQVAFQGPTGVLELADISGGAVHQFGGTIAGLNAGTSTITPTNAVNIQTTVTGAVLSGNTITVSNNAAVVATLVLSAAPAAGTTAVTRADATLGGYDVFLVNSGNPLPTVTWSPATETGVEGSTIALGTIAPTGTGLTSVLVSGIPVGATLGDGTHSFVATTGTTSVNVLGWNYAGLSIKPPNDANFSLSVQATDGSGNVSAAASEAVTVNPLAPTLAPVAVTGTAGQAIALNLGITSNALPGDSNSLASVTLGSIPTGATLSNTAGNTLTVTGGSITFSASQIAAGYLTGLAITPSGSGSFTLSLAATEQDAQSNLSTTTNASETLTVAGTVGVGGTISTSITGPYTLTAATNPLTITSTGKITSSGNGITGASGTTWTIGNSGTINASTGSASGIRLSGPGIVTNSGMITTSGSAYGVGLDNGGTVSNSGTIIGGEDGVRFISGLGTLINSGSIASNVDDGIGFFNGGSVTNAAGASISNLGTKGAGIYITGGAATVTNSGTISGIDFAIDLAKGGVVTNTAGGIITSHRGVNILGGLGTVSNSGSIVGTTSFGVRLQAGGAVTNAASASISGPLGVAVYAAAGTVTNSGTISGTTNAVTFAGTGANRLVMAATGVLIGNVVGSTASGSTNTLELAGGTGTLSGLTGGAGSIIENGHTSALKSFNSISVDAGGNWTMSGKNAVANLLNNGSVTIAASGSLDVSTAIDPASSGLFLLTAGSTLEVAAALGTNTRMSFLGSSSLTIDKFGSFGTNVGSTAYAGPQLVGFGAGDTVDILGFSATGDALSYNALTGVLQISNGSSQLASLAFQNASLDTGSFQVAKDGGTGIIVTHSLV